MQYMEISPELTQSYRSPILQHIKKSTQPLVSQIDLPIDLEPAKNEMPNPDKPELRIEEL